QYAAKRSITCLSAVVRSPATLPPIPRPLSPDFGGKGRLARELDAAPPFPPNGGKGGWGDRGLAGEALKATAQRGSPRNPSGSGVSISAVQRLMVAPQGWVHRCIAA